MDITPLIDGLEIFKIFKNEAKRREIVLRTL